jgi:proteasome lid subunit RPN8/RPN11
LGRRGQEVIVLSARWEDFIRREGEKFYPNECCGILLGRIGNDDSRVVEDIVPIKNAWEAEEQYHRFQIGPEDMMKAEQEARRRGLDVLGFYHSHPDHPAKPSDFDREQALPFYSYIITAVDRGRAGDFASWELKTDRSLFLSEAIQRV